MAEMESIGGVVLKRRSARPLKQLENTKKEQIGTNWLAHDGGLIRQEAQLNCQTSADTNSHLPR